ncbi:hypothetical protein WJX74_006163 [Apatococcus lobatus]|uniref:Uncharacterized protein n=1 Tax=Apatococcus lobatus TaxID=904363 RepID=A0AAW1QLD2_9CHLO
MTAYDFEETDQLEELRALGRKVQKAEKAKDPLVKLLKAAGKALEATSQTKAPQQAALALAKGLVASHILQHKDKDVRVLLAFCFSQLFRLYAPETPFPEETLPDVFSVFLAVVKRISDPHAAGFQACFQVMEVISKVKCYLLLMDMEEPDLLLKFFREIIGVVNADNEKTVSETCLEVLTGIFEESEDLVQPLLDMVLEGLLPPCRDENPAQYRLSQAVLRKAEPQVQPTLQMMLSSLISGEPSESVHRGHYHHLIFEVYQVCPQTLLPVLPRLAEELHADDAKQRSAATSLVGSLFSLQGSDLTSSYADLFDALLKRLEDREAYVRLKAIDVCKQLLSHCECQAACAKAVSAVELRIQDFSDRVRASAAVALCEAAAAAPLMVPLKTLEAAAGRMRDKQPSVRKEAISAFAGLFRASSSQIQAERTPEQLEMLLWIPGCIAQACVASPELPGWAQETFLKAGLMSPKMPPEDAARLWGLIYSHASSKDKLALMRLLKVQAAMRAELRGFVKCREAVGEHIEAGMDRACLRLAGAGFADPSKAKESLHKLAGMRDNHIFKSLAAALDPGSSREAASKAAKDALSRVGTKGAIGDMARSLCAWAMPTLLLPEHLKGLCSLATSDSEDSSFMRGVEELLADAAAASPLLFVGLHGSCTQLLQENELTGARVLSYVGSQLRSHMQPADLAVFTKNVPPILRRLCSDGSAAAAKASSRALAHVTSPAEISNVLAGLCQQLMDDLPARLSERPASLMPALQALSMTGRICPAALAPHASALEAFVMGPLLLADLDAPLLAARKTPVKADHRTGKTWGHFSEGIRLKAFAIKALARGLCGDLATGKPPQSVLDVVDALVAQLTPLLDIDADMSHLQPQGAVDEGHMRLAASCALLRLARAHDSRISVETYFTLALTMQDQYMEVRQTFSSKVQRTMLTLYTQPATHHKAAKYVAMLSLAGMDPAEANQQAALTCLHQFVTFRRKAAKAAAAKASQQAAGGSYLHEHPEWILPFAIQVLAHHPEFPQQQDLDAGAAEALDPFLKMLQFTLEPLLLPLPGPSDASGTSLQLVSKLLRTLARTEDATVYPATACIHLLCALGQQMAPAILAKNSRNRPAAADDSKLPGVVPLPAVFFRPLKKKPSGAAEEELLQLPADFQVEINELFTTVPGPVKTPVRKQASEARTGPSPGASPDDGEAPMTGQRKRKAAARPAEGKPKADAGKKHKPQPPSSGSIPSCQMSENNKGDEVEDVLDENPEQPQADSRNPLRAAKTSKADQSDVKAKGRRKAASKVDKENATPEIARRAAPPPDAAKPGRSSKAAKADAPLPQERPSRKSSRSRGPNPPQYTPASSSSSPSASASDVGDDAPQSPPTNKLAHEPAINRPRKAAKFEAASSPAAGCHLRQPSGDADGYGSDNKLSEQLPDACENGGGSHHQQLQASASSDEEPCHQEQPLKGPATREKQSAVDAIFGAQLRADRPCKPDLGASDGACPAPEHRQKMGTRSAKLPSAQKADEHDPAVDSDPYSGVEAVDDDDINQAGVIQREGGARSAAITSRQGSERQAVRSGKAEPQHQQQRQKLQLPAAAAQHSPKASPRKANAKNNGHVVRQGQGRPPKAGRSKANASQSREALQPSASNEESPLTQRPRQSPRKRPEGAPIEHLRSSTPDDSADAPSARLQQRDAPPEEAEYEDKPKPGSKHVRRGPAKAGALPEPHAPADKAEHGAKLQPGSNQTRKGPSKVASRSAATADASDKQDKREPGSKYTRKGSVVTSQPAANAGASGEMHEASPDAGRTAKATKKQSAPKGKAGNKSKPAVAGEAPATRKRKAGT